MAKLLDDYYAKRESLSKQLSFGKGLNQEQLYQFNELLYRINVMETLRMLMATAPVTLETRPQSEHFRVFSALVNGLMNERQIAVSGNPKEVEQRKAAHNAFSTMATCCLKSFHSYVPSAADDYRKSIEQTISAVLSSWVPYRDTFVKL